MRKHSGYVERRTATVAGIFYPENREELDSAVRRLLSGAPEPDGCPIAIISPHGAFTHSGSIAAAAWNAASGTHPARVVIIGPSHNAWETGVFLPESGLFETPLGDLPVDTASVSSLAECDSAFRVYDIPHLEEHSVEVQLPFMQILFPDAMLIPLLISKPDKNTIESLTAAIDTVFGEHPQDTLFVITTNIASDRDAAVVRERAARFGAICASGDLARLVDASLDKDAPCGGAALAALHACRFMKGCNCRVVSEGDSESLRENLEEHVVGYAAVAFGKT